jgi:YegS/Rv2252/BmrU family lipid kinase
VLVVNTCSRRGARHFLHIYQALCRRGIDVVAAYPVGDPSHLREVTRNAFQHGTHLVVVGGGDGTISSVVDEFIDRDVTIGIIPLGTGNSTALTLGLPISIQRAVDVLVDGEVGEVDLGKIGDDYYVNVVAVGLTAETARHTPYWLKQLFGAASYIFAGLHVLLRHRPFQCRLQTDGQQIIAIVREVVIANGRYFGETVLSPEASIHDGLLTVHVVEEMNIPYLIWRLFRYLILRKPGLPGEHHFSATELQLDADPPQSIDVDGESVIFTPTRITIAPHALKVMLPRG